MSVQKHLIWLVPLALAGCKKSTVEAENATVAQVAEQMNQSSVGKTELKPGLWEATMKIDNITIPGATPQAREQLRKNTGQPKTMTDCLTEEKAKRPFDAFTQMSKDCRYEHFKMGQGQIDSTLVCVTDGVTRKLTMQGVYKPTEYQLQMHTSGSGGRMNGMDITMTLNARRTGECPA